MAGTRHSGDAVTKTRRMAREALCHSGGLETTLPATSSFGSARITGLSYHLAFCAEVKTHGFLTYLASTQTTEFIPH